MPGVKRKKNYTRTTFETITQNNALTVRDVIAMHKRGVIGENDYLFTLEGLKKVAHRTYKGAWANCRLQVNPKSRHSQDVGTVNANEMINDAFT